MAIAAGQGASVDTGKRPNIIVVFTDQQRWDTCDCYRETPAAWRDSERLDPITITPNLDRMARDGVLFRNAFTCQPVCGPARACIQVGKFAEEIGCPTNHRRLPADEKTIAHYLSETGYDTAYIGKWHLASFGEHGGPDDFRIKPVPPDRRGGYDSWLASDALEHTSHSYDGHMFDGDGNRREFPSGRYRVDAQTDWVLEYLRDRSGRKPFLLLVSYIEPHHQNDHEHYEGPRGSRERFGNYDVPGDLLDTEGDWREEYPDYLGCCASLDANLGRVCEELERLCLDRDTVIIYTSDHGSHFRTRNREYKRSCHDGCIRVPMVIRGPGFTGGKVVDEMSSLIDIAPTVLDIAGVTPPDYMRGMSLRGPATGIAGKWRDEVFLQISEHQCGRAIRTDKWKYSVSDHTKSGWGADQTASDSYTEDFLYDLDADPHERKNLVMDPAYADARAELSATLKRRMVEAGER